jgi:hypothetical protein
MSFYAVVLYQLVSLSTSSYKCIVASCSLRLEVKIIVSTELRTLVLDAIKTRAIMTDFSRGLGDPLGADRY